MLDHLGNPIRNARVIYADPAWRFDVWNRDSGLGRAADAHYSTMTLDEIKALPVGDCADPAGCALIMWATMPMLPEALDVMRAWGFEYKTAAFVWAKLSKGTTMRRFIERGRWHFGMGYYTRANAELALLGTYDPLHKTRSGKLKGRPVPRKSKAVRQLIVAPVQEHSRKPVETYARIEALFAGPYVELNARSARPGWQAWGNEVGKFDDQGVPAQASFGLD